MVTQSKTARTSDAWSVMHRVAPVPVPKTVDVGKANARRLGRRVRNDRLVDLWSAAHFAWAAALAFLIGPWWAFGLMVAWEPFEILVLGPLLSRKGIAFGHETWRNSLSDIVFDGAGAAAASLVLLLLWDPLGVL
jgi:hypothetical protein